MATPQEIVDLRETLGERMRELNKARFAEYDRLIEEEQARVQALCKLAPGHLFEKDQTPYLMGKPRRVCIYCHAKEKEGV